MPAHTHYMQRAIALAETASGRVSPNPLVGSVVVKNGRIVGEGYHQGAGLPHAEINALEDAGSEAQGATLYVTLEPCAHEGRTPPCTTAIIRAGIARVVYAVNDPNPTASGGAAMLRAQGIETIANIEESAARHLARFFLHHTVNDRPYIVAKYATSLDGKIASHTGHSQWITGSIARQRSHELRQSVDGIVIGAQTAIDDNPSLTVRLPETSLPSDWVRHPVRYVLDSKGRVPISNSLFQNTAEAATEVITTDQMSASHERALRDLGVEVTRVPATESKSHQGQVAIPAMLDALGKRGVQSLMVEGGQAVLGAFMDAQVIDEAWAFVAPKLIGGTNAPGPIGGQGVSAVTESPTLTHIVQEQLGNDWLVRGRVNYSQGVA